MQSKRGMGSQSPRRVPYQIQKIQSTIVPLNSNKEQYKYETGIIKQSVRVRQLLGRSGVEVINLIESSRSLQAEIQEFFVKLDGENILIIQDKRVQRLIQIFQSVFVDHIIKDNVDVGEIHREGFKLAGDIFKEELLNIVDVFRGLIKEIEQSTDLIQKIKSQKIVLLTDYQKALELLVMSYQSKGDQDKQNESVALVGRSINHFKLNLQQSPQNQKEYLLIGQLEELLKSNYNTIREKYNTNISLLQSDHKMKILQNENVKLTQMVEERSTENYIGQMWKSHQSEIKQSNQNVKLDDDQYQKQVKRLMQSNKTLKEEFQFLERRLQMHKNEVVRSNMNTKRFIEYDGSNNSQQQDQRLSIDFDEVSEVQTNDQGIQCTFIQNAQVFKRDQDYFRQCKGIENYQGMGSIQSKEWVQAIINAIFIDKITCDLQDYTEVRQAMRLQQFTYFWFLRKFGIKPIAFQYFADFYFSLKTHLKLSDRFLLFANLSGYEYAKNMVHNKNFIIEEFNTESKVIEGLRIRKSLFAQYYLQSHEACSVALYIASTNRTQVPIKTDNSRVQIQSSFLFPDEFKGAHDQIKVVKAIKLGQDILAEASFQVPNYELQLKKIVSEDLRASEKGKMKKDCEEDIVKQDHLIRIMINIFIDQRYKVFDQLFQQLNEKSKPSGESQVNFTDFQAIIQQNIPRLTDKFVENLFKIYHKELIQESTPLEISILSIIPYIFDDFLFKPFYPYVDRRAYVFRQVNKNTDGTLSGDMIALQKVQSQICDYQTQVQLQSECYGALKSTIEQDEEHNENLQQIHSQFSNLLGQIEYSIYNKSISDKGALLQKIEQNWQHFRKIAFILYSSS